MGENDDTGQSAVELMQDAAGVTDETGEADETGEMVETDMAGSESAESDSEPAETDFETEEEQETEMEATNDTDDGEDDAPDAPESPIPVESPGELSIEDEDLKPDEPTLDPAVSVESLGNYTVEEEGYRFDFQTVTRRGELAIDLVIFKDGHQGQVYRGQALPDDVADTLGISRVLQGRINGLLKQARGFELPDPLRSESEEAGIDELKELVARREE